LGKLKGGASMTTKTQTHFKFTKAALAAMVCPPDRKALRVSDTLTPGLTMRITEGGARVFYLYRKVNGRPVEVRIGGEADCTLDQARRKAVELNGDIVAGRDIQAEKRATREAATLADLWDAYKAVAKVKARSWRDYEATWRRYLAPWARRRLGDIAKGDVIRLHSKISEGKVDREGEEGRTIKGGPVAANRALALLSIMFNAAGESFGITTNPARGVKRAKEAPRERYLSDAEMGPFLAAVDNLNGDLAKDFIRLALYTGARRANLQAMRWADIALAFATWTIERDEMKAGRGHVVPLVPQAVAILQRRRDADPKGEWVFPTESASGHIEEPKKAISMAAKAAGIAALSTHDLRRTCATWLNSLGASEGTIAALLAHKRQTVTGACYVKATLDTVRAALGRAVDAMEAAAGMAPATKAAAVA
jgi:integrase